MSRLTVVIKRNAKHDYGMFGVSLHDETGGVAKVQRINSEAGLRASLLKYGVTDAYAEDILRRLKRKHQSVELTVAALRDFQKPRAGARNRCDMHADDSKVVSPEGES